MNGLGVFGFDVLQGNRLAGGAEAGKFGGELVVEMVVPEEVAGDEGSEDEYDEGGERNEDDFQDAAARHRGGG